MKTKRLEQLLSVLMAVVLAFGMTPMPSYAADAEQSSATLEAASGAALSANSTGKAKRTVMVYLCGSNLETNAGMASYNLRQILKSNFSAGDDVKVVVMTGGSYKWQLAKSYLSFPGDVNVPKDAVQLVRNPVAYDRDCTSQISNVYNQVWEAKGADAPENAGKLVLLDGDGITGADGVAVPNDDELMSDPDTLKAFIDYCADNYPAEKYDLVLWDHGGGPVNGFGIDEHFDYSKDYEKSVERIMSLESIVNALAHNKVVDSNDDGTLDGKFDLVDFDACLMGSLEMCLTLADYADYYIASAEVEPGYGQYYGPHESPGSSTAGYKGWLDELGKNPECDTFQLGKIIVDDFIEFYERDDGDGSMQDGTLAVFDLQKMIAPETGFIAAITEMGKIMKAQASQADAKGRLRFYDELRSFFNAFENGDMQLFDLAGGATMLGVVSAEVYPESIAADGSFIDENEYTALSRKFYQWFRPDLPITQNEFMYGRGTSEIKTGSRYYQGYDGNDAGVQYGTLYTGGLSLYFPGETYAYAPIEYYWALDPVLEAMPVKDDGRYAFLKGHEEVVADYGLILLMGRTVDQMLNDPNNSFEVTAKSDIDADTVLNYWHTSSGDWEKVMLEYFAKRDSDEAATEAWLRALVDQQISDAVFTGSVSAARIKFKDGDGYRVTVNDVNKRIAMNAERSFIPELPAVKAYAEGLTDEERSEIATYGALSVGSGRTSFDGLRAEGGIEDWLSWFDEKGGTCDVGARPSSWYAVKDAEGSLHIASVYLVDGDWIYIPSAEYDEEGIDVNRKVMLEFHRKSADATSYELATVYYMDPSVGPTSIGPRHLKQELTVMPILQVRPYFSSGYYVPISKSPLTISSDNANSITLEYTDVSNIPDIEDVNGDGKIMDSSVIITDIYGCRIDVSRAVSNPTDPEIVHIGLVEVAPGQLKQGSSAELVPVVTYNGEVLKDGVDYTWEKDATYDEQKGVWVEPTYTKAGSYDILLAGMGRFTGSAIATFNVTQAPLTSIGNYTATLSKTSFAYTGKVIKPVVKVSGLNSDCYTVTYANNKKVGTATVTITGKQDKGFTGTIKKTFKIVKAKNPLAVKGKTAALKASALKSKAKKLKVAKVIKFTNKGKGKLAYTKVKGNKKIAVNKKTGLVTVKKGLKKNTYTVKVRVRAAGNGNFKPLAKTIKFKVKVK